MQALITGGAGFIGSHLSERLLNMGYRVSVIDDLSTGRISNIAHLKKHERFSYHIDTVFNRQLLAELVDECDVVFHLAAAVGVQLIVDSPVYTLDTNVRATELVLQTAAKKRKKVLVTSTSEVYGKATKIPFHEDDDLVLGPTIAGRWSYACSKAVDEFLALGYYREKRLPVVITRLFNTVGPRQSGAYGMVLPRFVNSALSHEPILVYGTGEQSRCFTWVGDVVNALVQLSTLPAAVGRVFNIGSDEEISINQLAYLVKEITKSESPIEHIPYEAAYGAGFEDMMRRVPDLGRVREAIGYKITRSLPEIIEEVVASMREGRKAFTTVATAVASR